MRFPHKAERVTHHKVVAVAATKQVDVMSSYNKSGGIPVGFRFHPTDEELVGFYLFGRITSPPPDPREPDVRIIRELDLYRHEPWDLSEVCRIPGDHSVNQNNWYFFSHKDKKYPTGNRANRATKAGFWKATGRDKCIQARTALGMRKTLVFYRGRAPHGHKTDWIMHEFRLDDATPPPPPFDLPHEGAGAWVVCRVFRKTKNLKASGKGESDTPTTSLEEDHQMALLPEITDSTEKLSSDEGEHVDYAPPEQYYYDAANVTSMQQQQCKQELLSVADYGAFMGGAMLAPHMFSSTTFQLDHPPSVEFEHSHLALPTCSSNPYLQAMLDEHHVPRADMLDELEDFTRFGGGTLDQSLADVVTRPLQHQHQQQLHQSSELLSSTPHHDMVPFGLPWQASGSRQPTFLDFPNTTFLPPGE